jgi:hypothetical protein
MSIVLSYHCFLELLINVVHGLCAAHIQGPFLIVIGGKPVWCEGYECQGAMFAVRNGGIANDDTEERDYSGTFWLNQTLPKPVIVLRPFFGQRHSIH